MNILITGASGFLGGRLSEHLFQCGHNISLGVRKKESLPLDTKFGSIREIDWRNKKSIQNACLEINCVIHCAAMNAADSQSTPLDSLAFNAGSTINLMNAANNAGVDKIIYLSTIHVYGKGLLGEVDEFTLPIPIHPYAISKKTAEDYLIAKNFQSGPKSIILRLSNCFGISKNLNESYLKLFVHDICRQAVLHNSIQIKSDYNFARNYITASDFCNTLERLIGLKSNESKANIYNLGDRMLSLEQMLGLIKKNLKEENIELEGIFFSKSYNRNFKNNFNFNTELITKKIGKMSGDFDHELRLLIRFFVKNKKLLRNGY